MTTDLRVMTFNVRHGTDLEGRPALTEQAKLMTTADVVLLQELDCGTERSHGRHQLTDLQALGGFEFSAFGPNLRYQGGWYGTGLLSRLPIRRASNLVLPTLAAGSTTDTDGKVRTVAEPRGVLWVEVETSDGPLLIGVHHASLWREERVAACAAMSAVLMNYPGRVIVGGDMNTNEEDELDLLRNHSVEVSCPELTYPSDVPQLRIDRLFVKGLEIVRSSVQATTVSDHRPLYAIVR